jgi:isopentenyldiphosphate isomerase
MELWDLYDKDRLPLNKTHERGVPITEGEYHIVVHVCIFNSKGEMLIQQRQPFKQGWPNMWDITVGGSAVTGDSSQEAASREVLEEIGLELDLSNQRPHLTINFDQGFDDVYLVNMDVDITKLKLQYEEVQTVKWATIDEIFTLIDDEKFIPYHQSLIQLLFDTRSKYGTHK